jgi:hypothetical protein
LTSAAGAIFSLAWSPLADLVLAALEALGAFDSAFLLVAGVFSVVDGSVVIGAEGVWDAGVSSDIKRFIGGLCFFRGES